MKIVGIVGSLRKESYNKYALEYVKEILNDDVSFEILDISSIPMFNEDLESNIPESVKEFKEKISEADAIIISTPEYNFSIPGVLKNALDWASREPYPFDEKKVAIMSSSIGVLGGARMQYHLRQVLLSLNADVIREPEVFIMKCDSKFDESGKLIDEFAKKNIKDLVENLLKSIKK